MGVWESGGVGEWESGGGGEGGSGREVYGIASAYLVFLELGTGNHDVHMSCTHHSTFYMFGR